MPQMPKPTGELNATFEKTFHSLTDCELLTVGYSGGVDSTALLLLCREWAQHNQVPLLALHLNHQLNAASAAWQVHCEQVCKHLGIELRAEAVELPLEGNQEAQARDARYAFFRRNTLPHGVLALAHHGLDQSETVLLRLLQGRGTMAMKAHARVQNMRVVRPLLGVHKDALISWGHTST